MNAPRHSPRLFSAVTILFVATAMIVQAQELPKKDANAKGADFDFEPKLMLNDLPDSLFPAIDPSSPNQVVLPPLDVVKIEAELQKTKKTAAWRERLFKAGVLSKVEAEQGALRIVRLTRDLEAARLQALTREVEEKRRQAETDATSAADLATAESALISATTAANEAAAQWNEAQRAAAELRVQRERKLLAVGAGTRSSVKRAEAALQILATSPK